MGTAYRTRRRCCTAVTIALGLKPRLRPPETETWGVGRVTVPQRGAEMMAQRASAFFTVTFRPRTMDWRPPRWMHPSARAIGMVAETFLFTALVLLIGRLVGIRFGVDNPVDPRTPARPPGARRSTGLPASPGATAARPASGRAGSTHKPLSAVPRTGPLRRRPSLRPGPAPSSRLPPNRSSDAVTIRCGAFVAPGAIADLGKIIPVGRRGPGRLPVHGLPPRTVFPSLTLARGSARLPALSQSRIGTSVGGLEGDRIGLDAHLTLLVFDRRPGR